MRPIPDSIRRIAGMLTGRYLQRCHEEGIDPERFLDTMRRLNVEMPQATMTELFQETFRRCKAEK